MPIGPHDGVLLVAHGTVTDLDDLPAFLQQIRRGRPASPELCAEIRHRYEVIGGSPLLDITRAQASALSKRLDAPVLVGMRLWRPTVEDVLRGIGGLRLRRLCVLPLAPFSVHVYWEAAQASLASVRAELGPNAPELVPTEPWGTEPALVEGFAAAIRSVLGEDGKRTAVVLTAHSLPTRAIREGDPYEAQFRACATAVSERLGRDTVVAFQSQGADGGDWLGPDLKSVLELEKASGAERVVLSPIGFPAEHVETLYDLDVEAAGWARELGLELTRVRALNDDPSLVSALESVVRRAFG
ncbi:MAG: ferrochelatase [Polyangiaceae bacterium]|nr:ferrochelatase [Polyangiaceae bacterium]MCE7893115.1 ferrochelatase [Sorangiineae bacterium PRO1]MCL4748674.1 ferrochelatase [Myxococcales bacterium]